MISFITGFVLGAIAAIAVAALLIKPFAGWLFKHD